MVLSVVIIAGLIGGGGLGLEVLRGINHDPGRGHGRGYLHPAAGGRDRPHHPGDGPAHRQEAARRARTVGWLLRPVPDAPRRRREGCIRDRFPRTKGRSKDEAGQVQGPPRRRRRCCRSWPRSPAATCHRAARRPVRLGGGARTTAAPRSSSRSTRGTDRRRTWPSPQILLEDKLGYTVKTDEHRRVRAVPRDSPRGRSTPRSRCGRPGTRRTTAKYIEGNNGVVDGGKLGVTGQIGWYIPTYMVTAHPELATWEGLKQDAGMFKTAEIGSAGPDPGRRPELRHVRSGHRRRTSGLDLKVVYAGLGGGGDHRAQDRVREAGPDPHVLLDAPLGAGDSTTSRRSSFRPSRQQCTTQRPATTAKYDCGVPAGRAVQGVQRPSCRRRRRRRTHS